jgi:GWxTD domain-containing protein
LNGSRTRRWPWLAVVVALAASAPADEVSLKRWIEGPVRYIAEREEAKVFKKLKSDEDRAWFIERFWARRDPSPETLTNEYRQLFWQRVRDANSLFLDSHRPGWLTDRGKIYILYGPPTKIEDHHDLDTQSGPTAGRGLLRWVYEGRPEQRMDLDPVVIVPFVRQSTGEYRVSYDPKLSSVFFDALAVEEQWDRAIEKFLEIFGAPRATEMSVMLDLGRMQEVPPQAQILLERVETVESYSTHPVDVDVSRYVHPDGSGVVAVVTVDVDHVEQSTRPAIITRFRAQDASDRQRMLGEDSFRVEHVAEQRVAQGRVLLEPGSYDVTVLVADPATASTGMHRTSIRIPEPSDRLRLSDVIWAEELSPLEFASLASHDEPYLVGPFRVVPRLAGDFSPGETLRLFYEVYGGTPPYRVSYQVEGLELDGSWVRLGRPATAERPGSAQGWEFPTAAGWPEGDYRVRIDVEDSGERLITTQLPFRLTAGAGPPGTPGEPTAPDSAP